MKVAVKSLLTLLDVGTGFCYWLLGRDLLEEEIKCIQDLFMKSILFVNTYFKINCFDLFVFL